MNITAKITGIKYRISLSENLKNIDINDFNINESPVYCLVKAGNKQVLLAELFEKANENGFEVRICKGK